MPMSTWWVEWNIKTWGSLELHSHGNNNENLSLMLETLNLESKSTLWRETSYALSCPSQKPSRKTRVLKSPPRTSMPYVKVGSTEALNRWDLSSQHVTLAIVSFLKVPIKASKHVTFTFYSMAQNSYVNRNQSQRICIRGLSQFGLCLGKMHFGLISLCCSQISWF
jgi:hypothetical protein